MPVLPNAVCKEKYRKIDKLNLDAQFSDLAICAGYLEGGKDSCGGDSGGPLMLPVHTNGKFPFYQIGIVAYGIGKNPSAVVYFTFRFILIIIFSFSPRIGCARPEIPGMYTNVVQFTHWIDEKLKLKK